MTVPPGEMRIGISMTRPRPNGDRATCRQRRSGAAQSLHGLACAPNAAVCFSALPGFSHSLYTMMIGCQTGPGRRAPQAQGRGRGRTPDAGRRTPDAGRRTPDAGRRGGGDRAPDAGQGRRLCSRDPVHHDVQVAGERERGAPSRLSSPFESKAPSMSL